MRLKTLRMWKYFKPVAFLVAGWAVCSAVMLVLFSYHLFDFRGGLPEVEIAASQTVAVDEIEDIKSVEIFAEGASGKGARAY
ncbi:MAG: hypothetical protein IJ936_06085 [Peptococcaceae bacterium]|nr:hypothetical protein [Peptococcaceae bacterium]